MNDVPGASSLGWGFNIFGPYSDTSLKSQIFQLSSGKVWTDPISGTQYDLPANVALNLIESSSSQSEVFDNRTELQEHFAAKAGIEASYVGEYGAFSGAFNAAFESRVESESSFTYALYESNNVAWRLALESQLVADLTPAMQQEIASLPKVLSADTQAAFFSFFDRFGTHFVSQVEVGGRLYYYFAVDKSYLSKDSTIEADATLEYNAVLLSSKATAESEWSKLTKSWTEHRTVHVETVGGTPEALLLAAPEYGDSRSSIFHAWVESIKTAPAAIDFQLRPISVLFPSSQTATIEQAMAAYMSDSVLVVNARSSEVPYPEPTEPDHLPVVTLGGLIQPETPPQHDFGFQLVVMKPITDGFEVFLNRYYSIDLYEVQGGYGTIFDEMLADLNAGGYTTPGYLLVLASFNWFWQAPPSEGLYALLRSAGAGAQLESWMQGVVNPGSINHQDCAYAFVGATGSGPGQGAETMAKAAWDGGPLSTVIAVRVDGTGIERINDPTSTARLAVAAS